MKYSHDVAVFSAMKLWERGSLLLSFLAISVKRKLLYLKRNVALFSHPSLIEMQWPESDYVALWEVTWKSVTYWEKWLTLSIRNVACPDCKWRPQRKADTSLEMPSLHWRYQSTWKCSYRNIMQNGIRQCRNRRETVNLWKLTVKEKREEKADNEKVSMKIIKSFRLFSPTTNYSYSMAIKLSHHSRKSILLKEIYSRNTSEKWPLRAEEERRSLFFYMTEEERSWYRRRSMRA